MSAITNTAAPPDTASALITGGAHRIGRETARTLHAAGYRVAVHYRRSSDAAQALVDELNATRADSAVAVRADLLDADAPQALVAAVIEHYGQLDLLVNNASNFYPTPIDSVDAAQFDDLMATNVKAPLLLSSAAAPHLARQGGVIINIVDIYADRPLHSHVIYSASKAALRSVTQSLAMELGPRVRVNAVAPGAILWHDALSEPDAQADMVATTALGRRGAESDIAGAVLYLARDAVYVTGQVLKVDGGRSLSWPGPAAKGVG